MTPAKIRHRITVDSKPGRWPEPVISRWFCSCGAAGKGWMPNKQANAEAEAHAEGAEQ